MGWTSYDASHYKKDGSIDRKAELDDELFRLEGPNGHKLLKSAVVGSTYYAAVRSPKGDVYALVVLTHTNRRCAESDFNFSYKDMTENSGPFFYDCPESILRMLSPTENEYAKKWREECRRKAEAKKSPTALSNLPIGTKIRFLVDGKPTVFEKHAPDFQFKHSFWYNRVNCTYIPQNRIPRDFEILG